MLLSRLKRASACLALALGVAAPSFAADPVKIGFVYLGPTGDHGWTFAHDQGRKALEAKFGNKIKTTFVENVPETADSERVFRQLAMDGNKVIFGTSFGYMNQMVKVAKEYPGVIFEHSTGYKTGKNLGVYNIRHYQSAYLAGVLAGKMSKTGKLGFVGSIPIPEVLRNINAFTLGARSVNPKITTRVIWVNGWFDPGKEREAALSLISQGADVLLQNTDSPAVVQAAQDKGVYAFGWDSDMLLVQGLQGEQNGFAIAFLGRRFLGEDGGEGAGATVGVFHLTAPVDQGIGLGLPEVEVGGHHAAAVHIPCHLVGLHFRLFLQAQNARMDIGKVGLIQEILNHPGGRRRHVVGPAQYLAQLGILKFRVIQHGLGRGAQAHPDQTVVFFHMVGLGLDGFRHFLVGMGGTQGAGTAAGEFPAVVGAHHLVVFHLADGKPATPVGTAVFPGMDLAVATAPQEHFLLHQFHRQQIARRQIPTGRHHMPVIQNHSIGNHLLPRLGPAPPPVEGEPPHLRCLNRVECRGP